MDARAETCLVGSATFVLLAATAFVLLFGPVPPEFPKEALRGGCQTWSENLAEAGVVWGNATWARLRDAPCLVSFDQHAHTMYGGGGMDPDFLVIWHLAHGYNAFAVTDHMTTAGCERVTDVVRRKYPGRVVVLPGVEWTTERFHINFVFPPNASLVGIAESLPGGVVTDRVAVADAVGRFRSMGAIATFDHPVYSSKWMYRAWDLDDARYIGVDAVEVADYVYGWSRSTGRFCEENDLGQIAGSDVHRPWNDFSPYTLSGVDEFTPEAVYRALREGAYVASKKRGSYP